MRLVVGPSSRRPEFNPSSVHVRFVMDKVALRQFFLRVLLCSPLNIISSFLRNQTTFCFYWKEKPENPGMITKNFCFPEVGEQWTGKYFQFILKHNQRYATLYNVLYCCQCFTGFDRFFRSSSGAQKLYIQHRYLSTFVLFPFRLNQASGTVFELLMMSGKTARNSRTLTTIKNIV
jgi:hypothetical protein